MHGTDHHPANQQLIEADQLLYNISNMLGAARNAFSGFYDYAKVHKAYEHAYHQERKMRTNCARVYEELYGQHNKAINELNTVHKNNRSLHKQLEAAQEAMHTLESAVHEQQRSVKDDNAVVSRVRSWIG